MSPFIARNIVRKIAQCCLLLLTCMLGRYVLAAEQPDENSEQHSATPSEAEILAVVDEVLAANANTSEISMSENRAEQPDTHAPEAIDPAVLERAQQDRVRYARIITELENSTSQNIYNPELTEAYLNLAGTLETLSLFEEASVLYNQALQTTRIGSGLDSLEQIPILERLLANSQTQQEWDNVDTDVHLIFHIARRNFPVGDPRRLSALEKLGKWKLKAATEALVDGYARDARDALGLYDTELELVEAMDDYEGKSLHMAALHLGEARAMLVLAAQTYARPLTDYQTSGRETITTQTCRNVRMADGRIIQVCETIEVPNIDYYLDPSLRKNQEIGQYLEDIRENITLAYDALQDDGDVETRIALLAEMQELTESYNTFVTKNSL